MGTCKFCGQPAGLWKSVHKECDEKNAVGKQEIAALVSRAIYRQELVPSLHQSLTAIRQSHWINDQTARSIIIEGWDKAVERAFDDGVLTEEEEKNLVDIMDALGLSDDDLDRHGSYTKIVKGAVLRDLFNGIIPQRMRIDGSVPFNLQRSEMLVWVFPDAKYLETNTRSRHLGWSTGTSVRICRGVYWRIGQFLSRSVPYTETTSYGGYLGVTTKHLYFSGSESGFRIPYDKIVSWEPYSDGIGITRGVASAKPQLFVTGDGWFTYNLVMNLAQMHRA